jgi:hypothetical protein
LIDDRHEADDPELDEEESKKLMKKLRDADASFEY